jgi:hypothetical protein
MESSHSDTAPSFAVVDLRLGSSLLLPFSSGGKHRPLFSSGYPRQTSPEQPEAGVAHSLRPRLFD